MENKKKIRQERIISSLIMIVCPSVMFIIFYYLLKPSSPKGMEVYTPLMFSFGVTTIFNISCIMNGLFKETFSIVVERLKNFFSNAPLSFKFAVETYFYELKTGGIMFWVYLFIFLGEMALFIVGLTNCLTYYFNY